VSNDAVSNDALSDDALSDDAVSNDAVSNDAGADLQRDGRLLSAVAREARARQDGRNHDLVRGNLREMRRTGRTGYSPSHRRPYPRQAGSREPCPSFAAIGDTKSGDDPPIPPFCIAYRCISEG